MAQMAMVMNLDKCIGCHLLGHLQAGVDQPGGTEYVWFNNVETRPGQGYPRTLRGPGGVEGRLDLNKRGRLKLKAGAAEEAVDDLLQPEDALDPGLLRALDLRLRDPDRRPAQEHTRSRGRSR